MPSMREPDVERLNELYRSVTVYNLSDEVFVDEYMKTYYRIPARSKRQVPAMVACHWFGDPSLKKHTDARVWEKEKRRVRDRRGNPNSENPKDRFFENMIATGKLLCYEFGTHLPEFYEGRQLEGVKFSDGGTPIADGEMDLLMSKKPLPPQGPIQFLSDDEVFNITREIMGTGVDTASVEGVGLGTEDRVDPREMGVDHRTQISGRELAGR